MWYLLQGLVIFAVVASNIHWQWTPNGYLATMLGGIAALCVTGITNELRDWQLRRRAERRAAKQKINQSPFTYRGPRPPPLP